MISTSQTIKKIIFLGVVLFAAAPVHAATVLTETDGSNTPWLSSQTAGMIDELEKEGVQVHVTDKLTVIMRVDNLFRFPTSTRLADTSQSDMLRRVAHLVRSYGSRLVTVSGHTDNVGSDASKLKRSHDQADTVAAFLWSQGIPLKNLLVIGCGDTEPVASNDTAQGSAANRRVEVEIQ